METGQITTAESKQSLLLWLGVLTGPAAWAVQLTILYSLEEFISCTPASRTQGVIWGLGVKPIALVTTVVLALATAAAGLVATSCWRKSRGHADDSIAGSRARWMALMGILSSVLFLAIIVVKIAPPLLLGTCQTGL